MEEEEEEEEEVTSEPLPRLTNKFINGRKICGDEKCKQGIYIQIIQYKSLTHFKNCSLKVLTPVYFYVKFFSKDFF